METDFLFARPSFLEGVSRVVDLSASLNVYNRSSSAQEADEKALASDFSIIGKDIFGAVEKIEESM